MLHQIQWLSSATKEKCSPKTAHPDICLNDSYKEHCYVR